MPIYEYVCDECGERFEVFQRNRDTHESPHAQCGGTGRRVMSQTSFALKGSGWYRDHYGLKSSADSSSGGGSSASTGSSAATAASGTASEKPASSGTSGSEKKGDAKKPAASSSGKSAA